MDGAGHNSVDAVMTKDCGDVDGVYPPLTKKKKNCAFEETLRTVEMKKTVVAV